MSVIDAYHADTLADGPTLSASVAVTLIQKSPAHAYEAHPRLNPNFAKPEEKKAWDLGTVVHSLLLEGTDVAHVVEGYDDWRTKAAQAEAAEAREQHKIPMLRHQWEEALTLVDAAHAELVAWDLEPPPLTDGVAEQPILWTNEKFGVVCRCRPDWRRDDSTVAEDVKTSVYGADPFLFSRKTIYSYGYDLRAAMYLDGIRTTYGTDATWRWIVLETKPPFTVSVVTPSDDTLAIGHAKYERALEVWRDCLESGLWPGYGREIHVAEPPAWETRWLNTPELEESAWSALI